MRRAAAAGQPWEAGLLTKLLAVALPRIVDLAVTAGYAGHGRLGPVSGGERV